MSARRRDSRWTFIDTDGVLRVLRDVMVRLAPSADEFLALSGEAGIKGEPTNLLRDRRQQACSRFGSWMARPTIIEGFVRHQLRLNVPRSRGFRPDAGRRPVVVGGGTSVRVRRIGSGGTAGDRGAHQLTFGSACSMCGAAGCLFVEANRPLEIGSVATLRITFYGWRLRGHRADRALPGDHRRRRRVSHRHHLPDDDAALNRVVAISDSA